MLGGNYQVFDLKSLPLNSSYNPFSAHACHGIAPALMRSLVPACAAGAAHTILGVRDYD